MLPEYTGPPLSPAKAITHKLRFFQECQGHFYVISAPFLAGFVLRRAAEAAAQYMEALRAGDFSPGGASTH